jgi:hypothetical protein
MAPWPLVLALLFASRADSPARAASDLTLTPGSLAVTSPALVVGVPTLPRTAGEPSSPACSGDVCQPRIALPGREPQFSQEGRRTDLALSMLERTQLEPVASVARVLERTGLRLNFTPRQLDAHAQDRTGWGHVLLGVRWRIDAHGVPAWLEPSPG